MFRLPLSFLVIPALAFLVAILNIFLKAKSEKFSYLKNTSLLSEAEKNFYFVLAGVIEKEYLLFSKVRIFDILSIPKGLENGRYYQHKIKIQSKHVDFLLCDTQTIEPLLVIELDDSSHSRSDRISRDNFVDGIFEEAKLPILHIRASSSYNENELLQKIQSHLKTDHEALAASLVE